MFRRHDPPTIAAPGSAYAHAVEVPAGARWLLASGQVPVRPDGSVPDDFDGQYRQVWHNIDAILASAGMARADIIRMVTYVTSADHIGPARETRDALFAGLRVASTLVVVSGLANAKFMVEIEVTAAKAA
jgi:enamine deaminase RidA (YjgF/YER057c/UK114 family)